MYDLKIRLAKGNILYDYTYYIDLIKDGKNIFHREYSSNRYDLGMTNENIQRLMSCFVFSPSEAYHLAKHLNRVEKEKPEEVIVKGLYNKYKINNVEGKVLPSEIIFEATYTDDIKFTKFVPQFAKTLIKGEVRLLRPSNEFRVNIPSRLVYPNNEVDFISSLFDVRKEVIKPLDIREGVRVKIKDLYLINKEDYGVYDITEGMLQYSNKVFTVDRRPYNDCTYFYLDGTPYIWHKDLLVVED